MFETLTRKSKAKVQTKLKQKDKDLLTCFLCQHYQVSTNRQYVSETTTLRLCLLDGKYKGRHNQACSDFQLCKYFYCNLCGNMINTMVCKDRQEHRRKGCSKACRGYGKMVFKLIEKGESDAVKSQVSGTSRPISRKAHNSESSDTDITRKALRRS